MATSALKEITVGAGWKKGGFTDASCHTWKNSDGVEYDYEHIPVGEQATYTAVPGPPIYWAVKGNTLFMSTVEANLEKQLGSYEGSGSIAQESLFSTTADIPWYSLRGKIKSVVVGGLGETEGDDIVQPYNMALWFYDCTALTTVKYRGLNVSQTVNISYLYYNCSSLKEFNDDKNEDLQKGDYADLKGLKLNEMGKLWDIRNMFYGCKSFAYLDFKKIYPGGGSLFNKSFANYCTNYLFAECSNLVYLDISNWDFVDTHTLYYLFYNCEKLTTLELPKNFGQNALYISGLFYGCASLKEIKLDNFSKNGNWGECNNLFKGCEDLETIYLPSAQVPASISSNDSIFSGCTALKEITVGSGWKQTKFVGCPVKYWVVEDHGDDLVSSDDLSSVVSGAHGNLTFKLPVVGNVYWTFSYDDRVLRFGASKEALPPNGTYSGFFNPNLSGRPDWKNFAGDIDSVKSDGENPVSPSYMSEWFRDFVNCTSIDLSGVDMSRCVSVSSLFRECRNLTEITWPGGEPLPTGVLGTTSCMFYDCQALKTLDLHNFCTSGVTNIGYMFYGCSGLEELDVSGAFVDNSKADYGSVMTGCESLRILKTSGSVNKRISVYGLQDKEPVAGATPSINTKNSSNPEGKIDEDGNLVYAAGLSEMQEQSAHVWRVILTVTVDRNDGTGEDERVAVYKGLYGEKVSKFFEVTDPVREGYDFLGWKDEDTEGHVASADINAMELNATKKYTALWEPRPYAIVYYLDGVELGPEDIDDNPTSYTIDSGDISLKLVTKTGYDVAGWYDNAECEGEPIDVIPACSMGDKTFYAKSTPIQYTIVFDGNEATEGEMSPMTVSYDESVRLPSNAFRRKGYIFSGVWAKDSLGAQVKIANEATIKNLADTATTITLYALWTAGQSTYTVIHRCQALDGTYPDSYPYSLTVTYGGETDSEVEAPRNAYDGFITPDAKMVTIRGDNSASVTYNYERKAYDVALTAGTGVESVAVSPESNRILYGDDVKVTVALKDGYKWDTANGSGWTATAGSLPFNATVQNPGFTMPVMEDGLAATVKATPIEYTIAYDLNAAEWPEANWPSDVTPMSKYTVEMEEDYTLPKPERPGYKFLGWSGTGIEDAPRPSVTVAAGSTGERSYTANWEIEEYKIEYKNLRGGKWGGNQTSYTILSTKDGGISLNEGDERNGATFEGWYTGYDEETGEVKGDKVESIAKGTTGNLTYYANWELIDYCLEYDLNDENSNYKAYGLSDVNPHHFTVEDDEFELPNVSRDYYEFKGWFNTKVHVTGESAVTSIPKGTFESKTVYARWTAERFNVIYELNDGVVNHPDNPSVHTVEDSPQIKNPTWEGYVFRGWSGTGLTDDTNKMFFIPDNSPQEYVYTANWNEYEIRVHHCRTDKAGEEDVVDTLYWNSLTDALDGTVFDVTTAIGGVYGGVTSDYLYGGMWTDGEKTALRNDVCGKALDIAWDKMPAGGLDIFIREVPNCYGVPYLVNYRMNAVYHTFLMVPVDFLDEKNTVPYSSVGFAFSVAGEEALVTEQYTVFDNVILTAPKKSATFNTEYMGIKGGGALACYELSDDTAAAWHGSDVELRAYLVTTDNVKVTAVKAKLFSFGDQNKIGSIDSEDEASKTTDVRTFGVERLPMLHMSTFSLDDAAEAEAVVTLHVDGLENTLTGGCGGDFRAHAGTPALEGSLFAGWFLDEECTEPADLSCVTEDIDVYARFVPAEGLLGVDAKPLSTGGRLARLRLLSACDDTVAGECGFFLEAGARAETVYAVCYRAVDGTTAEAAFGADTDAMLFYCDLSVSMFKGTEELKATPFWTTPDGSRVRGKAVMVKLGK
ncbi:MAG: InlB B-repeat-containing protein [Lentisphaeria bacterium]|nr:InlB B-repeat-containing protein [Lentisphaeria bacterium]